MRRPCMCGLPPVNPSLTPLQSIMTILRAHDFPVTSLRFNPTATLLLSGSADNSVRVIEIPPVAERGAHLRCFRSPLTFAGNSTMFTVLVTLLILLLAVYSQSTFAPDVLSVGREFLHL